MHAHGLLGKRGACRRGRGAGSRHRAGVSVWGGTRDHPPHNKIRMLTNTHLVSVHILVGVVISIVKQPQVARAQQHGRRIDCDLYRR